jgi:hypothetical protein
MGMSPIRCNLPSAEEDIRQDSDDNDERDAEAD